MLPARWLDRLSALLLLAALGGVAVAVAPVISASPPPASSITTTPPTAPAPFRWDPPHGSSVSASDTPPRFDLDGEPRITELERQHPDGMWPGRAKSDRREVPGGDTALHPRRGTATSPLVLRSKPDASAKIEGRIEAGETVLVIRESGDWALITHRGADDTAIGWALRRDVALQ